MAGDSGSPVVRTSPTCSCGSGWSPTATRPSPSYLAEGGPAYVDRYAADLEEMLALVRGARGVAGGRPPVGAWPAHVLDESAFVVLKGAGLAGIEVDHLDHDAHARDRLREIAGRLDLVGHRVQRPPRHRQDGHDLGCESTAPDQFRPHRRPRRGARAATAVVGSVA